LAKFVEQGSTTLHPELLLAFFWLSIHLLQSISHTVEENPINPNVAFIPGFSSEKGRISGADPQVGDSVGDTVGDTVGAEVVGELEGALVGSRTVGLVVGETVGFSV